MKGILAQEYKLKGRIANKNSTHYYQQINRALLGDVKIYVKKYIDILGHVVLFIKFYPKDYIGTGGFQVNYFCHAMGNRGYNCITPKKRLRAIKKHLLKHHGEVKK